MEYVGDGVHPGGIFFKICGSEIHHLAVTWLRWDSPLGQIKWILARSSIYKWAPRDLSCFALARSSLLYDGMRSALLKSIDTVGCEFKKFLASITLPLLWAGFFPPPLKRSEACLAEEAPEGGGNCHFYLQPSQTPPGLLSRWPLLKLSEALTPFSQLRVSIDTGWLWFSHIDFVSHVLLTVKTGWVDAGTWMPSGIKHYYTYETLLDQRGLPTIGFKLFFSSVLHPQKSQTLKSQRVREREAWKWGWKRWKWFLSSTASRSCAVIISWTRVFPLLW